MLLKLPDIWITALNIISWPAIMLSVSYLILKVDYHRFDQNKYIFRKRRWESDGMVYTRVFLVKKWKRLLPDGAAWFSGSFQKKNFSSRDPEYFRRFIFETCRGEVAHWISLSFIPVFFIYNPLWAAIVMVVFGFLLNFPCIITQRFNRIQLMRIAHRQKAVLN